MLARETHTLLACYGLGKPSSFDLLVAYSKQRRRMPATHTILHTDPLQYIILFAPITFRKCLNSNNPSGVTVELRLVMEANNGIGICTSEMQVRVNACQCQRKIVGQCLNTPSFTSWIATSCGGLIWGFQRRKPCKCIGQTPGLEQQTPTRHGVSSLKTKCPAYK